MSSLVRLVQESCPDVISTISECYKNCVRMLQEPCTKSTRIISLLATDWAMEYKPKTLIVLFCGNITIAFIRVI